MTDPAPLLDQLREQLVGGIARFERRRRRARVLLVTSVSVALLASATTLVSLGGSGEERVVTDAPSQDEPPSCPEVSPDVAAEPLSESGVPVVLFASNVNATAVAVADLDRGCRAVYSAEAHTLGGDVTDAAFTNNDELITGPFNGSSLVYPAGRTADGHNQLVDGGLQQPGRTLDGRDRGEALRGDVFPTDSGDAAWVLPPTDDFDGDKPLHLVDVENGEAEQTVAVPATSLLVDVVGDSAVLHPEAWSPDGSVVTPPPPGSDMLVVSPSGEMTSLEAPQPASFVTATPTHAIWITGGFRPGGTSPQNSRCPCGDRLLIVADDGETTSILAPGSEASQWADPGAFSAFSPSPPMVTSDGTRLLLPFVEPTDPGAPDRLAVVDLEEGTTVDVFDGASVRAFWARDDRTAVIVGSASSAGEFRQQVTTIDTVTGETTTIDDALPEDFMVVAAR